VEESLVEAHTAAEAAGDDGESTGAFGDWCSPQRSNTSYVRCLLEAVNCMLRSRNVATIDCKVVGVAIRSQFVAFIKHDLMHVRPDENGAKIIEMSCAQLSYSAAKLADLRDTDSQTKSPSPEEEEQEEEQQGVSQEQEQSESEPARDELDDLLNGFVGAGADDDQTEQQKETKTKKKQRSEAERKWAAIDSIRQLVSTVASQVVGILEDAVVRNPHLILI